MNKKYVVLSLLGVIVIGTFSYAEIRYQHLKQLQTVEPVAVTTSQTSQANSPQIKPSPIYNHEAEARTIANGGECRKNGTIGKLITDNGYNGSWVFEVNRYDDTSCMSTCSVNLSSKSSTPNYMCTGLIRSSEEDYNKIPIAPDPSTMQ